MRFALCGPHINWYQLNSISGFFKLFNYFLLDVISKLAIKLCGKKNKSGVKVLPSYFSAIQL